MTPVITKTHMNENSVMVKAVDEFRRYKAKTITNVVSAIVTPKDIEALKILKPRYIVANPMEHSRN
ncbi:unnamed protein product [Trichobilharzia szidati]|nr:unnamed protein product [Trichobilharzia szidati]